MTQPGSKGLPDSIGIKALDTDGIGRLVAECGEPSFRTRQLVKWLYGRGARSFDEMTDLSKSFRERLGSLAPLTTPRIADRQVSSDGTRKYLLELADGITVETVGLPAGDRLTVCFSTQAGCAMACSFCATGRSGLTRDLAPGEMVDQLWAVSRDFDARITNAVAMGQGEPFANYDATLAALRFMNSADGLGIGARHLTVSTCGLVSAIERFAEEPEQFTLAVSLHSAVQSTRDALMPGVRAMTLPRLRQAIVDYAEKTGRRPSVEFALADGVNDTDAELAALVAFCDGLLVHVNLIPINPVADSALVRPRSHRAEQFVAALEASGTAASVRTERGADIDAACGQLKQRATARNGDA
jgi:23S rRNA (adenine2503-C2)-methyltransferase